MADKITLIVHFKMDESVKPEFIARLREVFSHIEHEETFVEASLQQDLEDPKSILNYEVWRETPESFMKNQMPKGYERPLSKRSSISRWSAPLPGTTHF